MHKHIILLSTFCVVPIACSNLLGDSNSTQIKTITNQKGTKKAVLLENTGNATTDISLQVAVYDFDYELRGNEIGNAFSVDGNYGSAKLDSNSVTFRWLSNDTLLIDYDGRLRTFTKQSKVNDVFVLYKAR